MPLSSPIFATSAADRGRRHPRPSRGFTFTEVLFAVIILGIGFIMLAAMFPVALSQTKETVGETAGIQASTGAAASINSVFDGSDWSLGSVSLPSGVASGTYNESLPSTVLPILAANTPGPSQSFVPGEAVPLGAVAGSGGTNAPGVGSFVTVNQQYLAPATAIYSNQIVPSDPRYAWTILYRRDLVASYMTSGSTSFVPSPYAQLICIPVTTGVTSAFGSSDIPSGTFSSPTYTGASVRPQYVTGTICFDGNTSTYYFAAGATSQNAPYGPGSYLVINDDMNSNSNFRGLLNGSVYRLGTQIPVAQDPDNSGNLEFYFAPGWGFQPQTLFSPVNGGGSATFDANGATAVGVTQLGSFSFYAVGRYSQNGVYQGNTQEIGAFVTTVKVQ